MFHLGGHVAEFWENELHDNLAEIRCCIERSHGRVWENVLHDNLAEIW